jgi:HK97 family phage portal protein
MIAAVRRLVRRAATHLWNTPAAWTTIHRANVTDYTSTGQTVREQGWERHPVVQACCRAIVDIIQSVPLEVTAGDDTDAEVLDKHPLGLLLHNPQPRNPNLPGARMLGLTALHYLLYGNAFWHIVRPGASNRGKPAGLKLVHPEYVRSVEYSVDEDRILWYDWTAPESGTLRRSVVDDMIHFADLSGHSWLFGFPRVAAAIGDIVSDTEATRYVRQVVTNDGGPVQVFHMGENATREQALAAEERWREKRVQRGERGMVSFMSGTIKTETIGFNLQQLEFPDLRRVTRESICAAFPVDPRIIGISSAASEAGMSGVQFREARKRLIAMAATPLMLALENHLNHWLAPEYGDVRIRFSPNGLAELTEDETETSARAISEYTAGVRTLEEARLLVALAPERDPSHHIRGGMFGELMVADVGRLALPGAQAALAPPEPEPEPDQPPPTRALPAPVTRVARTPEQRVAHWRTFDATARQHDVVIEAQARALFAEDAVAVARLFAAVRADVDPPLTPNELELLLRAVRRMFGGEGESPTRWTDGMTAPISATMRAGAEELPFPLLPSSTRVHRAISNRVDRLATHVGQTSATQIEASLLAGQQAGWGVRQTADMINQTVFGGLAAQRSTLIARTESIGALNEGAFIAAQDSGIVSTVEWLTQGDLEVRDTHEDQDGQRLPIGQTFPNGCRFPGDPAADISEIANCRCTLLYD